MNTKHADLFEQFNQLNWLLHRYHQQNHKDFGPMGDTHRGQGRILDLLKIKPEISQKELSNILNISSQSLGELLLKLEKNGYITRTPSEADRRVLEIRMTEAGKKVLTQTEQQLDTKTVFTSLNEEEQEVLSDYLERIILTIEQISGDNDPEHDYKDRLSFATGGYGGNPGMHGGRPYMSGGRPPFGGWSYGIWPDWENHYNRRESEN